MITEAIARLTAEGQLDTSVDPRAVDEIGAELATMLEAHAIDEIVCWDGDDEAALAQVVGARLGVRIVRAVESGGLLTLGRQSSGASRVALIATSWGGYRPFVPLVGLVSNEGLEPVIAVSVIAGEPSAYDALSFHVLESM